MFRVHGRAVEPGEVPRARLDAWRAQCLAKFPSGKKKYQVIYADPPWTYENMEGVAGVPQYPVMTLDALKALPVPRVADSTSVLFLWATNPLLQQALELIRAWGFEYKTVFKVWCKRFPNGNPVVSLGRWSRPSTELLLVATRGSGYMKWKTTFSERQEFASVRGRHSEKPAEIRDQVRDFLRVPNRLELFARVTVPRWDAWGLEVPGFFHNTTTTTKTPTAGAAKAPPAKAPPAKAPAAGSDWPAAARVTRAGGPARPSRSTPRPARPRPRP